MRVHRGAFDKIFSFFLLIRNAWRSQTEPLALCIGVTHHCSRYEKLFATGRTKAIGPWRSLLMFFLEKQTNGRKRGESVCERKLIWRVVPADETADGMEREGGGLLRPLQLARFGSATTKGCQF
jgi:hypothetical protein